MYLDFPVYSTLQSVQLSVKQKNQTIHTIPLIFVYPKPKFREYYRFRLGFAEVGVEE